MSPRRAWRRSLAGRLMWPLLAAALLASGVASWLQSQVEEVWLAASVGALAGCVFGGWAVHRALAPLNSIFRAMGGLVEGYRDGDYSAGLSWAGEDEIGQLVTAHNRLGSVLREQRLALTQRELLLDTMVQNTPVAMLLLPEGGPVVYANLAARKLLNDGRRLEGFELAALLRRSRPELAAAFARSGDGVFSIGGEDDEEVFHLARRRFLLNGRAHELLLIRRLTQELRRQEVRTWKKVIRVMSHEMNNALGPIASLARSAQELLRRGDAERVPPLLQTIGERAGHLDQFLRGYAAFAKLPSPRLALVGWRELLRPVLGQFGVPLPAALPETAARVDAAQFGQALANLVGNALEAGSPAAEVAVTVRGLVGDGWRIEVADRGSGMSEAVMAQALAPFYSTKRSGSGLGLALAREIVEAHGGRIALESREGGGLRVVIELPGAA